MSADEHAPQTEPQEQIQLADELSTEDLEKVAGGQEGLKLLGNVNQAEAQDANDEP
jgi:hypothetical protein